MNRIVRLFLKASCLKKFRDSPDDVLVSLSENITSIHEFEMRHNTTIVRLLLIEGSIDEKETKKISSNFRFVSFLRFSFRSRRIFRTNRRKRFAGRLRSKFHWNLVFELQFDHVHGWFNGGSWTRSRPIQTWPILWWNGSFSTLYRFEIRDFFLLNKNSILFPFQKSKQWRRSQFWTHFNRSLTCYGKNDSDDSVVCLNSSLFQCRSQRTRME